MGRGFADYLAERRRQGLLRRVRTLESDGSARVRSDGGALAVFCSNDYLGLADDPRVGRAMAEAAGNGAGSGAAHLVSGHRPAHARVEAELAGFLGRERALLFSTGYMANLGALDALAGRGDTVVQDRLNHASLIDGGRLSGARLRRYEHGSADAAEDRLANARGGSVLATDGVFSMDGDVAPIAGLAAAARRHDALLMVDDAHGIGVLGEQGRGSVAEAGLGEADVPVLVGTLGKAMGVSGAFVAGSRELCDYLVQAARTYVYTTALPPPVAAAVSAAVAIARDEAWRREHLQALVDRFRRAAAAEGLTLMPSRTPIQPVMVGDAQRAVDLSAGLERRGYLVTAIRPPTVPRGSARLRVTLSAAHSEAQVVGLVQALAAARDALPVPS